MAVASDGLLGLARIGVVVGGVALQQTDGHGLAAHLQMDAAAFTLLLLRTDTAADGGQRTGLAQGGGSTGHVAALQLLDEAGNVDAHGATLDAARLGAVEAARSLTLYVLGAQTARHLAAQQVGTLGGGEFDGVGAGNGHALLGLERLGLALTQTAVGRRAAAAGALLATLREVGQRTFGLFAGTVLALLTLEGGQAGQHLVEIDLMAVKLGAIDADELRHAAHGDAAGAAHARAIDHDGVERYVGRDAQFLGQQADKLHHDGGADGEALVHRLALGHGLDAGGDQTLGAGTAVVGHNHHLVGHLAKLLLQDNKARIACGEHHDDAVAGLLEGLDDGQHRGATHTAGSADHGAEVLNMRGTAQRTGHVGQTVAGIEGAHAVGRYADALHHQRQRALFLVGISDGQGDALTAVARTHDDKMAGMA